MPITATESVTLPAPAPDYATARGILGNDFISPEEIALHRPGVVYSQNRLLDFGRTVPSREVLKWCYENSFMLVAGPPRSMSLYGIYRLDPKCFRAGKFPPSLKGCKVSVHDDTVDCRWLMIRKGPVPQSSQKTWKDQVRLLSDEEAVPNVVELVWGVTVYSAVRNVYLLPRIFVRTSSVSSRGNRVSIGEHGSRGLRVCVLQNSAEIEQLNLASSWKAV